jgi:hypothetical protein
MQEDTHDHRWVLVARLVMDARAPILSSGTRGEAHAD